MWIYERKKEKDTIKMWIFESMKKERTASGY